MSFEEAENSADDSGDPLGNAQFDIVIVAEEPEGGKEYYKN